MKLDETKKIEKPDTTPETTPDTTSPLEAEPAADGSSNMLLKALLVLMILVAGGSGAAAYYYYGQAKDLKSVSPEQAAQAEVAALLARISELILLPADEQPTVATVADPAKLQDQPFFKNSHKGDKVLIYTNARKAFLYDPVAHKIIEVAPVSIGAETAGATTPPPAPPAAGTPPPAQP